MSRHGAAWAFGSLSRSMTTRRVGADCTLPLTDYPGYAAAVNLLARAILATDHDCVAIVASGDDTFPDPHHRADDIARNLMEQFGGTLFVVQPTGDRWTLDGDTVPQIEKAAMSPWLGREWCERAYGGYGPLWAGYKHCWVDNDLQEVAMRHGVFAQRPDLTHRHEHWLRHGNQAPERALTAMRYWDQDKALFAARLDAGFPDSDLLPCCSSPS